MEFYNYTPFPGNAWETLNDRGKWNASCMIRAKFKLIKSPVQSESETAFSHHDGFTKWLLRLHSEQGELFDEDQFYNEEEESSVRYESDYVNYKAHTDVIVNARTYVPCDLKRNNWLCGVKIYSPKEHKLLNEQNLLIKLKSKILQTQESLFLPVRYEYCKGGVVDIKRKGKENEQYKLDLHNPVGCGKYPHKFQEHVPDARIEYLKESYGSAPAGLGFIHRSWKSRLDCAGTYDNKWLEDQHPLPPHDFDFYHNQAAHPALITKEYLQAGSKILLTNLIKDAPASYFEIPDYRFLSRVFSNTHTQHQVMHLDTLIIDIDYDNIDELSVYTSWRSYTPLMNTAIKAEAMLVPQSTYTSTEKASQKAVQHG